MENYNRCFIFFKYNHHNVPFNNKIAISVYFTYFWNIIILLTTTLNYLKTNYFLLMSLNFLLERFNFFKAILLGPH